MEQRNQVCSPWNVLLSPRQSRSLPGLGVRADSHIRISLLWGGASQVAAAWLSQSWPGSVTLSHMSLFAGFLLPECWCVGGNV